MLKDSQSPRILLFVSMCVAVTGFWLSSASVLYLLARPLVSPDNGRSLVFDPLALIEATSILVAAAILCWMPIFVFARRSSEIRQSVLTSISTWILLSISFFLMVYLMMFKDVIVGRSPEILGYDNYLIFLPIIIPALSILSGLGYFAALRLSHLMTRGRSPVSTFD